MPQKHEGTKFSQSNALTALDDGGISINPVAEALEAPDEIIDEFIRRM